MITQKQFDADPSLVAKALKLLEKMMECPYCKEIALPVDGGECESCGQEVHFHQWQEEMNGWMHQEDQDAS